ncbi:polysaccharide biosynthesis C-terminal domain-containing protein, partial [uncultured Subdoligranulum sp.]
MGFVLVFCLNEYVGWNHRMLGSYRAVLGHFEQDQWFMVASAGVNLALSFALFPVFDITGALIATVVAHCIMWAGRIVVVFRRYMQGSMGHYLCMQGLHLVTLAVCLGGTWALCRAVPLEGWLGLVPRAFIVCLAPNLFNLLVYGWGPDAAYLRRYAAGVWQKLIHKRSA